ncbi:unnamed protein product [Urochloa decumbens]|uniref:WRKY domain-containing protein n=1 Tax=Urochloa decumbens TaxID=240449 RepID=A0ABC8YPH7_9POAL
MTMDTPAAVVLELMTMGQQSAKHLGDLLRASSPASPHQELAAEILRCCSRVIDTLRAADSGRKRKAPEISYHQEAAPPAAAVWSPPPPPGPPPKRRARGAEAVKEVTSGTTTVDGFIWRKYGQKEINGHKHPRLYYRCAHKQQQGCNATRRVQRTQDHPAAYEIAYYGEHTCRGASAAACHPPPPAVVDFGSTSWGSASAGAGGGSPSPAASVSQSQGGGWSSPSASASPSSEIGFELEAHGPWEWRDAAAVEELIGAAAVEELIGAAPCYGSGAVTEFLNGSFGWESVLNDPLDFAGLHHHIATTFQ